ncbi:MAG: pilin [Candidatus Paceibacterota bacterium]|jgi:hypothetical protein
MIYKNTLKTIIIYFLLFSFSFSVFSHYPMPALAEDATTTPEADLSEPTFEVIQFDYQTGIGEFIKYIIKWAFRVAGLLAFIMIVYAGFLYLTAGGNTEQQKEAQSRIFDAIIGIILLFSFWLILYTINPDILGAKVPTVQPPTEEIVIPPEEGLPANFVLIGKGNYASIPLSSEFPNGAYIDKAVADKLLVLTKTAPNSWKVTEACVEISNNKCVTTISHQSECHNIGTCVDIGFGGDPGSSKSANFINAANEVGFDVLNEYKCSSYGGSGFHVELNKRVCANDGCWFCAD